MLLDNRPYEGFRQAVSDGQDVSTAFCGYPVIKNWPFLNSTFRHVCRSVITMLGFLCRLRRVLVVGGHFYFTEGCRSRMIAGPRFLHNPWTSIPPCSLGLMEDYSVAE